MGCSQPPRDVTPPASLKRKLQESKAGGLMPSALPGSYKPVPFRAAVVDILIYALEIPAGTDLYGSNMPVCETRWQKRDYYH